MPNILLMECSDIPGTEILEVRKPSWVPALWFGNGSRVYFAETSPMDGIISPFFTCRSKEGGVIPVVLSGAYVLYLLWFT